MTPQRCILLLDDPVRSCVLDNFPRIGYTASCTMPVAHKMPSVQQVIGVPAPYKAR